MAVLQQCRLLLTNDTGPMHLAVSVGTPVMDLSVGHVDFRETGPYGPGHWVIQPDLDCAPCGFDRVCPHHACKDRLLCDEVAALCAHALGAGPGPPRMHGVRVYESGVDEDGLGCYRLRIGREDPIAAWYGQFWRRFWYETFTGRTSGTPEPDGPAPDSPSQHRLWDQLSPALDRLVSGSEELIRLSARHPLPVTSLQACQQRLAQDTQRAMTLVGESPAFGPLAVVFLREKHNVDAVGLGAMARQQADAYRRWRHRARQVAVTLAMRESDMAGCPSA